MCPKEGAVQDGRIANLLPQLWAAQTLQIFLGKRERQREPVCEWLTLAKFIANTTIRGLLPLSPLSPGNGDRMNETQRKEQIQVWHQEVSC